MGMGGFVLSKKCQFCGADLPDDALFCMRCGEQVRAGGDFSGFGGLSVPGGEETAQVEVPEIETREESVSAAESDEPAAEGNAVKSDVPATEGIAAVEISAVGISAEGSAPAEDSAKKSDAVEEEISQTPAAERAVSRRKSGGFALFRIGASLLALLLAALLSMQKVARYVWMGITMDFKTLGFLNLGSQTSTAYVKILLFFATAGLVAGSCILFARGFAGAIRFFREGKPFPAEKYLISAFAVWVGYLVFLSACATYVPGPAAVGMLVVFCILIAGFLAREFYERRKKIAAAPGEFVLKISLFVCTALMFGLFGGNFFVSGSNGLRYVTVMSAVENTSKVALPLILMLGGIALLSLGTAIFERVLLNLFDGGRRSVFALSVAFLCVGILMPVMTAILIHENLTIGAAYVFMLIFAAGVVALSAVLRTRNKRIDAEQPEEQKEFDTAVFERWKGIDRRIGDIFKILSATFGVIVILVLFVRQFLPMYPADGRFVNVIDFFIYATGQPLNVTMVNALALIGIAGANLVACAVVLILAIVRGIKMLSSGKCGDMSGLVATSLGVWLVTQGFFASSGESLGNAFSLVLGLSVAALVAAVIVRYCTDSDFRKGESLAKTCADTVAVTLITLWFQSHVYLRSFNYWETNTTWFSVLTVLLMLSAAALGIVGGVLWCRVLRAAAGAKRNRRLGLIAACLALSVCGFLFYCILMTQLGIAFLWGALFVPAFAVGTVVWETKYPAFRGPKINGEK